MIKKKMQGNNRDMEQIVMCFLLFFTFLQCVLMLLQFLVVFKAAEYAQGAVGDVLSDINTISGDIHDIARLIKGLTN